MNITAGMMFKCRANRENQRLYQNTLQYYRWKDMCVAGQFTKGDLFLISDTTPKTYVPLYEIWLNGETFLMNKLALDNVYLFEVVK